LAGYLLLMAKNKERLDKLLVERGLAATRAKAQALVMAGEVLVEGEAAGKPGMSIPSNARVELVAVLPYASRGGFKLAAALEQFGLEVSGRVCADVGACTGGFTDVLLQRGAARVYAIDVGYGQLEWRLRKDERVAVLERTNARYLETLAEPVNFACMDVSFISVKLILPAVKGWLVAQGSDVVVLIKPQFEAGREKVGKGGIVKDAAVHRQVLEEVLSWAEANELAPAGLMRSPIEGAEGNTEFLAWLRPGVAAADWRAWIEPLLRPTGTDKN
jgi:23S rRNA (cytidine1920-2'-O)/16S rRNA (cytidine1409-2'-O)-methyltransferase